MKIFGLEIRRSEKSLSAVPQRGGWRTIFEPFTGAWQRNQEEKQGDLICYPTLYACISRIAQDVGKLPFVLKSIDSDKIWQQIENPAYSPVLRKPNHFQTAQQFRESWMLSKLTQGNVYVLKQRDNRGVVISMYVLDPCRVMPLVADNGEVFYQLQTDRLNLLPEDYPTEKLTIPASDIIHDRCMTVHHPLVGVPPLCAAHWSAVKTMRILRSSAEFFGNRSQPSGILTAPAGISDEDAAALSKQWADFSGKNAGKIAVIGADMKFTAFAATAADSQLIEQLQYSDRQICQPFGIPPYIVGVGEIPAGLKVDDVTNTYYSLALQAHIEAMEDLLDEALSLSSSLGIWLDTEPLLRMDASKQADYVTKLIGGKAITPDEGRKRLGYGPTGGGGTLWGQNQDYPLGMLADRAEWDPNMAPSPAPPPTTDPAQADESKRMASELFTLKALAAARTEATR